MTNQIDPEDLYKAAYRETQGQPVDAVGRAWANNDRCQFKNFHRLLCERFGYAHDEQDWIRDQVSLIEHISNQITTSRAECEGLRAALVALDAATVSAIRENDKPHRVLFKDGFVLEGRGADEWLRFMRLIQTTCRAVLSQKETGNAA